MASSATSAIRKTANALSAEGELRNVNDFLKDVARSHEATIKAQENATRAIITWTERKREDPAIAEFVSAIGDLDAEGGTIDRRYIDHFRLFIKLWKDVLAEKKELNAKIGALKKARQVMDSAQKKVQRAELKDPPEPDKLAKYRASLAEAAAAEKEATNAVSQKLFDCQVDKHQSLRTGYTGLYQATMNRFKELVLVQEKVRTLINSFPQVVKRNDDGTFVLEPYSGPSVTAPIWWQGERLAAEIEAMKKSHSREMDALHQKHSASLSNLMKEREQLEVRSSETLSSEIQSTEQRHRSLMQSMRADHAQQLESAQRKLDEANEEHAKAVATLENRLGLVQAELDERQHELLTHISDETKLEEQIEAMKLEHVLAAVQWGQVQLSTAAEAVPQKSVDSMHKYCGSLISCINECVATVQAQKSYMARAEVFQRFGALSSLALVCAVAAARSSKAENSGDLLEHAENVAVSCAGFSTALKFAAEHPSERDAEQEQSNQPPPAPDGQEWYVAQYDHEQKVHQGISLVGFKKGDLLLLEKKRDDGWSKVRIGDVTGWAPTSYIKPHSEQSAATPSSPGKSVGPLQTAGQTLISKIEAMTAFAAIMAARDKELDALHNAVADDIGSRVSASQQAILDALAHVEKLVAKSKAEDQDRQLEVNQTILERVRRMLECLSEVVTAADQMRTALKSTQGKTSDEEFNRKHSSWLQALAHAVDTATDGNALLTEALRSVIGRKGKHEELQVAARNIAATVAQLASLSRTKTLPEPIPAQELVDSKSQAVISISHEVLAAVRESQELELASVLMENLEDLSDHDAKKLLMSTQVKVLKLEAELTREREKLGALRRRTHVESGLSEA